MIFVVFVLEENGKYWATADTIRTGQDLLTVMQWRNYHVCHLCESRAQADKIALEWNETYRANGTNLF